MHAKHMHDSKSIISYPFLANAKFKCFKIVLGTNNWVKKPPNHVITVTVILHRTAEQID